MWGIHPPVALWFGHFPGSEDKKHDNQVIFKDSDSGRDFGQEEKGTAQNEMAVWHH